MSTRMSAGRVRSMYEFIKFRRGQYGLPSVRRILASVLRILAVAPSGHDD